MKRYRVKVEHGTTTHNVVVRARSLEESMDEALRVLKLNYSKVTKVVATEAAR